MKISEAFGRMMAGTILMFAGVLLMFSVIILPIITEIIFGNIVNFIIGAILFIIGFSRFTNQLRLPKRQKKERVYQKSKHELLEIFGLK